MSDEGDPIIEAGDDGVILADGHGPTVHCPNGHTFDRDEARRATFDGDVAPVSVSVMRRVD